MLNGIFKDFFLNISNFLNLENKFVIQQNQKCAKHEKRVKI